jgi:hypothetical protein
LLLYAVIVIFARANALGQIMNGGFEKGNLAGWTASGGGSNQILTSSQFAPLGPTEGSYFALIGNGPGDIGNDGIADSGILTSDPFTVSSASILQFDYDFLTAEFTGGDADPNHLDSFSISLLSLGNTTLLAAGDVSLPAFTLIDGGNAVSAPDGTSVIEHLGFLTGSVNLGPGTYSLGFRVDDAGDGSFDSALLVDNVRLAPAAATPETGSLGLLATVSSALGLVMVSRRRKQKAA